MVDEKLYAAWSYNIARDVNHGFMYRKDIFDKQNIPMWTDSDEFYSALKKLKEIYPNSTPLVSKRQFNLVRDFALGWGFEHPIVFDSASGTYVYSFIQPKYKEVLDYMRLLYSEGLIDPEFLTSSEASWAAKMTQNEEAFVTFDWIDRMELFYEQIKDVNPDYDLRFAAPVGPNGGKYRRLPKAGGAASFAVNNNSKKEYSMKLVDFLLSPAGSQMATLGLDGISYAINDDGKVEYLGMDGVEPSIKTLEEKYGLFVQYFAIRFDTSSIYYQFPPRLQEAQDLVKDKNWLADAVELWGGVKDGVDIFNEIFAALDMEYQTISSKYIVSPGDPTQIWNEWLVKAKQLGVDEMVTIYNNNRK